MEIANRVIKNTGYLYAKMGITMFISLYATRLILNSLGAIDFGIFNIVGGAITMLGFLNAAMASATQRFMSFAEGERDKNKQKSIFNVSVVLHLIISFILGVALLVAGYFFFEGILNIPADRIFAAKVVYWSLIISTMFAVMTVPYDAVMNAHENMKYYAIVGIIESLLKLAVALMVVYTLSDKLIIYGILMTCIPLITLSIMRVYCHKHYTECVIAPKKYWHKGLMEEMTSFAGWSLLGNASTIINNYGINIVVNIFFGTTINATQGIANQISGQLGVLGTSIKKSLNPIIDKSAGSNDDNLMIESTIWGTKIIFFLVSMCFLPVLIEMPFCLKSWLINPPPQATIFCQLLLVNNLLEQLVLFLPQAIGAKGKIKAYQAMLSAINFMPIILITVIYDMGVPAYSLYIVTATVTILKNGITIYFANKLCNISWEKYIKNVIFRCVVSFALAFGICSFLQNFINEDILRLISTIIISILIYCFLIYNIGFKREERILIKESIQTKINHMKKATI